MRDTVFFFHRNLGKCFSKRGIVENWIIAESLVALGYSCYETIDFSNDLDAVRWEDYADG